MPRSSPLRQADYRLDGRETVIACALDGEVRGYLPAEGMEMTSAGGKDEGAMKELQERKQEYMQQLRALEQNLKSAKSGDQNAGIVPANTRINFSMETNHSNQSLDMVRCGDVDAFCVCHVRVLTQTLACGRDWRAGCVDQQRQLHKVSVSVCIRRRVI